MYDLSDKSIYVLYHLVSFSVFLPILLRTHHHVIQKNSGGLFMRLIIRTFLKISLTIYIVNI